MSPDSGQQPKQESLFLSAATAAKNNSTRQIQLTRTERVGPAHRTQHTLQTDPCGAGGTWHLQEVRLLLNLILPFLTSTEILSVVVPHTHTVGVSAFLQHQQDFAPRRNHICSSLTVGISMWAEPLWSGPADLSVCLCDSLSSACPCLVTQS